MFLPLDTILEPCFLRNTRYTGKPIESRVEDSAVKCQEWCQQRARCGAFTYFTSTNFEKIFRKLCMLMENVDKVSHPYDMVSGPKYCPSKYSIKLLYDSCIP